MYLETIIDQIVAPFPGRLQLRNQLYIKKLLQLGRSLDTRIAMALPIQTTRARARTSPGKGHTRADLVRQQS